jgi:hypothetical protein
LKVGDASGNKKRVLFDLLRDLRPVGAHIEDVECILALAELASIGFADSCVQVSAGLEHFLFRLSLKLRVFRQERVAVMIT